MKKVALITGVTGQDGSYLAKFLLTKNYKVYGMIRRVSVENFERIESIRNDIELVQGDLLDQMSLVNLIKTVQPSEVYNLAAQSFVPTSFEQPVLTGEFTALGVTRVLEAIRYVDKSIRFYQASSSEMFGDSPVTPQNEETALAPRSPYGIAKVYGHWISRNYREAYNMFISSGILFNHESPFRGKQFVTRRISHGVAKIKLGLANELTLGNLQARRDWGFAGDYVEAMWLMLQQSTPDDFVIATGKAYSVEDFVRVAFEHAGLNWKDFVKVDSKLIRPAEINLLCGDSSKAKRVLGWEPKTSFEELVRMMVDEDIKRLKSEEKADPALSTSR